MTEALLAGRRVDDWVAHFAAISDPIALIGEAFTAFGQRAAIGTSGQMSGIVLIDMASRTGGAFRVFAVDTLRLHAETYQHWQALETRYGFQLDIYRPDPQQTEKMVRQHGEFLFFDSKPKQEYCCHVRKVEPNRRALASLDVWITGLRHDQSAHRADVPRAELVQFEDRPVIKLNPLIEMTEAQLWQYVTDNEVPYNRLFDPRDDGSRYPSLGCVICTTPIRPHEPLRAGRWRWFNAQSSDDDKECGIHS